MMTSARFSRPFFQLPLIAAALAAGTAHLSAAFVIGESTGMFTPSFRSGSNTTYFGWSLGSWDGNPADAPGEADVINGTPSINPDGLAGTSFLTQSGATDIVSSSNNIYSSVGAVNSAGLSLNIPTSGTVGVAGFTTIIIQGLGFSGFGMALDAFAFGDINGVSPTYLYASNAVAGSQGQWWAKWEIPGNQASYTVNIVGHDAGVGVLSVTDMIVDTQYSTTGYAADFAVVPEASTSLLGLAAIGLGVLRRRR